MSVYSNLKAQIERRELKANQMVRLIGYGIVDALPASEVKVGMVLRLNYGYTYDIIGVERTSKRYLTFKIRSKNRNDFGKVYTDKRMDTCLMAVTNPEK